jgi:hypothetical protein
MLHVGKPLLGRFTRTVPLTLFRIQVGCFSLFRPRSSVRERDASRVARAWRGFLLCVCMTTLGLSAPQVAWVFCHKGGTPSRTQGRGLLGRLREGLRPLWIE